jgi:NadR type nicotinamide-nucleotide adenylyltransferase
VTLGFVVGKFYPPHRGHKFLIDTARAQVDRLVVMVAHHPTQSIPGEVRKQWLEEIHPDCEIHVVPDELENDSRQWATFTMKHLNRAPDVVFSSEDYGPEFARLMGARHVMVDRDRSKIQASATLIRSAPLDHLHLLEPCVRSYYVLRVVLIGAESTGKTTLAQMLAEEFETVWVPEYGREHWERKVRGLNSLDPPPCWSHEEFVHIAQEQQARENGLARVANRILICDTNAFATGTWYERYFNQRSRDVDAIGARDKVDLYLLTAPDVPFVQDGFRDGERIRHWMHGRFLQQLEAGETEWGLVDGSFATRSQAAVDAVQSLSQRGRASAT